MGELRIAVIGGGAAGFMAAAHMTKFFPEMELIHVWDSRLPTLGVGEGTTPLFPQWIHRVTGASFAALQRRGFMTRKEGIRFENWGNRHRAFMHRFHPLEDCAYHVSAAKLVELLDDYVTATRIDARVLDTRTTADGIEIELEGGDAVEVGLALDARGFPRRLEPRHKRIDWIPTNAAIVRQGPAGDPASFTRAVARAHGWIFIIPLTAYTSYGYVYHQASSTAAEVEDDFAAFLTTDGVSLDELSAPRRLTFPNFTDREFFDGRVFRIGNRGSFLEPLEATALAVTLIQLDLASYWLLANRSPLTELRRRPDEKELHELNQLLMDLVERLALFISWHYARGSVFDTSFWRHARERFDRALRDIDGAEIGRDFHRFVDAAASWPVAELAHKPWTEWRTLRGSFGGCREPNFAEVGHGIDYFGVTA